MRMKDIPLPEVYTDSEDFRMFCKWFEASLEKIQYNTENLIDLYDPHRCPSDLLWALADTMGYTYDDRLNLPVSFNRLVLLYFMQMIYKRGSSDGVTLSAEVNLAQFSLMNQAKENDILYDRLDDTSIPANAVSVIPNTANGYIDVIYFSTEVPVDACIEYTRPLGMFVFQHAGVKMNAKSKVSIDARLTDSRDIGHSPISYDSDEHGSARDSWITQVAQYTRKDYASLQRGLPYTYADYLKHDVWYRNSEYEASIASEHTDTMNEDGTSKQISPGLRAIYSLQLSNNDNIVKSLLDPIFSLGYGPQEVDVTYPDDYLINPSPDDINKPYNLRYDPTSDDILAETDQDYIQTYDPNGGGDPHITPTTIHPYPAVNPVMSEVGDAISAKNDNSQYYQPDIDNE